MNQVAEIDSRNLGEGDEVPMPFRDAVMVRQASKTVFDRKMSNGSLFGSGRVILVLAVVLFALITPQAVLARPPVPADVFRAVRTYWKTKAERVKAFDVVACETGGAYNTTARNGQYLGLFQMGSYARARYGHGSTARAQARAAHAYYVDAGWSPWECA